VRVVAASNRPLAALRDEHLRPDLFFRVAIVVIELPPLRARPEDVLVLAQTFVGRISRRTGRQITLARSAVDLLVNSSFPGNVRELDNVLESATALSRDDPHVITEKDLAPLLRQSGGSPLPGRFGEQALSLETVERAAIQQALRLCGGNRTRASSLLGISRDTLHRKLRQYHQEG